MDERRPIPYFPDYSVDNLGNIRRDATDRVLEYKVNQYGVIYVGLMRDGGQRQRAVARIVAQAFVPRSSAVMDTPINLNGDRRDNRAENLTWRPYWYARFYNRQFKDPYPNPILVPISDLESGEEFRNSFQCAIANGLLERDVVLSILNRTYTAFTYQQFGILED